MFLSVDSEERKVAREREKRKVDDPVYGFSSVCLLHIFSLGSFLW